MTSDDDNDYNDDCNKSFVRLILFCSVFREERERNLSQSSDLIYHSLSLLFPFLISQPIINANLYTYCIFMPIYQSIDRCIVQQRKRRAYAIKKNINMIDLSFYVRAKREREENRRRKTGEKERKGTIGCQHNSAPIRFDINQFYMFSFLFLLLQ